ncbi:MAG: helix-hairpin-helix domain-containing protein [Pseudomonadota bacterium]
MTTIDTDQKEKTIIQGILERIVFQGEGGFLIGNFKVPGNPFLITAKGTVMSPQVGVEYKLTGEWVSDPRYGDQLRIDRYETIMPQDKSGIFKYLVRICQYVGPSIGNDLVNRYGEETINILKTDPGRVALETRGITPARAEEIKEALLANEVNERVQVELEALLNIPGMRKSLIGDLIEEYKDNAPAMVKGNPYFLTQFHGIGFMLADRVAIIKVGIPRDHIERKKAAAIHSIKKNMEDGNVWIHRNDLLSMVKKLIQVPDPEDGINELIQTGVFEEENGCLALATAAADERLIARFIAGGVHVYL